ncbi:very short patch repair endonuclease [Caballeronia catudaia]|uniref:very short patch repair endonuclease n=1 Tax=Caballeronia catudaia TaxID=1777136 RepID=UPI000B34FAA9|nr:very short patch repair endonuclease [Caballeronia catudaia]
MDTVDQATRSRIMARVRSKNSSPEMVVRRLVHSAGYRFRLHRRDLPGTPDLVFPGRNKVIFVHGCFWHRHEGCALARIPKTRVDFWTAKLDANRERDERSISALRALGWEVLVLWECELVDGTSLLRRLVAFLGPTTASAAGRRTPRS